MSVVMPVQGKVGFQSLPSSWPVGSTLAPAKAPKLAAAQPTTMVPTAKVVEVSTLSPSPQTGSMTPAPTGGYPGSFSPPFPGASTPTVPVSSLLAGKTKVLAPTAKATPVAPTTTMVPATAKTAAPVVTATWVTPPSSGTEAAPGMLTPVMPAMAIAKSAPSSAKAGSVTPHAPFMMRPATSKTGSPLRSRPGSSLPPASTMQSPRTGLLTPMSPQGRLRSGISTPLSPPAAAPVIRLSTPRPFALQPADSGTAGISIPRASYIRPTTQPANLEAVEREKQTALAALAAQFQQATDVISKQAELDKQELSERLKLESERFNLEVDRDLHAQAKVLDEQTNAAIMRLQQGAALQKAQLEQQATRMIQDYEAQKAEEDMLRRQTEIQRQYSTSQGHLSEQARGLQERATAHEKLRQEQERLQAALPEPFRALGAPSVSRQTSGVLRQTSGVLRQTSGVLRQVSGVLPQASGVLRMSSGVLPQATTVLTAESSGAATEAPGVVRQSSVGPGGGVVIQTLDDQLPSIVEASPQMMQTPPPSKPEVVRQTSGVLR